MIESSVFEFNQADGIRFNGLAASNPKVLAVKSITNNGNGIYMGASGAMISNCELNTYTHDYMYTAGLKLLAPGATWSVAHFIHQ